MSASAENRFAPLIGARALVTGASGFIGRRLVEKLLAAGVEVSALDAVHEAPHGVAATYCGDLTDSAFVRGAVGRAAPEYVFHLAAVRARSADVSAFRGAIQVNLLGSLSLLEACTELPDLKMAVLVGTAEEYGAAAAPYREGEREQPVSAYSYSKLAMTELALALHRLHGLPAAVLRPSVAYGPGQAPDMFISALVAALVRGDRFPMTLGEQTRDFVYVDDVVSALMSAAVTPAASGHIVNVACGEQVRIADVARLAERLAGVNGLVEIGAVPYREGEALEYGVDATLARELLGWKAETELEDGLRATIAAARERA